MSYQTLSVTRSDRVLRVFLDRPDRLNALSRQLLDELRAVFAGASRDGEVSVVLLGAEGPVFSVGYDVTEEGWIFDEYPADADSIDVHSDLDDILGLVDLWSELWRFPKPVVAQVQGPCLSGGGELLAVCDLVVASERAEFGHPAGRDLGIPPTLLGWPLQIGMRKTRELLYTAKSMDAAEAHRLGLVNHVVPAGELERFTRELARDVARTPVEHLRILKRATNRFYENMGLFASWNDAAQLDAIYHQSPTFTAFFKLVRERGLKAALEERARRFGD